MGDKKTGVKYVKMFTTAMLVYMAVTSAIAYLSDQIIQYDYPLTLANILGAIGFQLFLTGPSEEILFRALLISVITRVIPSTKGTRAKRLHISWATIISAVFFSKQKRNISNDNAQHNKRDSCWSWIHVIYLEVVRHQSQ